MINESATWKRIRLRCAHANHTASPKSSRSFSARFEFTLFEKLSSSRAITTSQQLASSRAGEATHSPTLARVTVRGLFSLRSPAPFPPCQPAGSWRVMPALSRANRGFSQVPPPWRDWFLAGISLRMRDPHPDPLFIHRPLATRFPHPRISLFPPSRPRRH